jgi:hypothetical protein
MSHHCSQWVTTAPVLYWLEQSYMYLNQFFFLGLLCYILLIWFSWQGNVLKRHGYCPPAINYFLNSAFIILYSARWNWVIVIQHTPIQNADVSLYLVQNCTNLILLRGWWDMVPLLGTVGLSPRPLGKGQPGCVGRGIHRPHSRRRLSMYNLTNSSYQ